MKNRILFIAVMSIVFLSCVNAKDVLYIDYKFNVSKQSYETNYFNWSFGNKKIKDRYDAVSQASIGHSTAEFNSVRYAGAASDKKLTLPAALRGLFLYSIADWSLVEGDALHVEESNGVITVRYAHHGKAYELVTDKKGRFNVLKDSKIAKDFAERNEEGQYLIKAEYLMEGGDASKMKDLNWEALKFMPDQYTSDAEFHFEGSLKFTFKNNVLQIQGKLTKK